MGHPRHPKGATEPKVDKDPKCFPTEAPPSLSHPEADNFQTNQNKGQPPWLRAIGSQTNPFHHLSLEQCEMRQN